MTVKEMVLLWHETQMGCMHKCREKHQEFADKMWKLYEEFADEVKSDNRGRVHLNSDDNTDN